MRVLRPLLCLLLFAGACSSGNGTAVDLTMTFDGSISADTLALVKTFTITTSGDDTISYTTTLDRAAMRSERQTYLPAPNARAIGFAVVVYAADGTALAHGSSAVAPLQAGATTNVSITLSSGVPGDLGLDGPSSFDAPPAIFDLPEPTPDIAKQTGSTTPLYAGSYSLVTAVQGEPLIVARPNTTQNGALMLAMIAVRDTADTNIINVQAPSGWTQLTSAATNSPKSATAVWFWKFANGSEPSSYTFTRTNSWPALGMIAPYNYVNTGSQFDATLAGEDPAPGPAQITTTHTNNDLELEVINVVCPDDFTVIFNPPNTLAARISQGVMLGDYQNPSHGDQNPTTVPSTSSTCRYLWMTTGIMSQ